MNEAIDNAIKLLANKINPDTDSGDALRYTQAALNLAHVQQVQNQVNNAYPR